MTIQLETIYEITKLKIEKRKLPKRFLAEEVEDYSVRTPSDFAEIAQKYIGDEDREVFLVGCLNTKNQIQSLHRCHIGTLNSSLVSPREVFKTAILQNSGSIIVAHNHPSQNVTPSPEDIEVTKRLIKSGELLDINVLDHVIVSETNYTSLKGKGYV